MSTYLRREGFLSDFEQTVRKLVDQGKSIIILAQVPVMPAFDRDCLKKSVRLEALECDKRSSYPMEPESEINAHLRGFQSISTKIHFIDFRDSICDNGKCSHYTGNIPQYFDKRHLSMAGSWTIGKRFFENKRMPSFFLDLAAID